MWGSGNNSASPGKAARKHLADLFEHRGYHPLTNAGKPGGSKDYLGLLLSRSAAPESVKLDNFEIYVRRQALTRFLARYELFKLQQGIKGSILEWGVHHWGGLMTWAKLSAGVEPGALDRRVIGFDTFGAGFPSSHENNKGGHPFTREFLVGLSAVSSAGWSLAYPYGSYNGATVELLKDLGCILAFTTRSAGADLSGSPFALARFDTNDLPPIGKLPPPAMPIGATSGLAKTD